MPADLEHIRQVMREADCLHSEADVEAAIARVGAQISADLADSNPVVTIMSRNNGASWGPSSYLGHAALTAFATPGDPHTPIALQHLSARLRANTIIAPATDLTLLDELPIDGHVTMQITY